MFTMRTKCSIPKGCSGTDRETDSLLTVYLTLWHSCATLWAILSNPRAVWRRLTCSVREQLLYQSPPAVRLKITSRHGSYKIKLYSEVCCPSVQWQRCEGSVPSALISGESRRSIEENPFSPFSPFKLCFQCSNMLLLKHGNNTVTLAFGLSKQWEVIKDETSLYFTSDLMFIV